MIGYRFTDGTNIVVVEAPLDIALEIIKHNYPNFKLEEIK